MTLPHYPDPMASGGQDPHQAHAYAAAPPSTTSRGTNPLGPPGGAGKLLWIGLLLMLVSFSLKQLMVDLSLNSTSNLLEKAKLQAKQQAEIAEIDEALDEIDEEIADLKANAPLPPLVGDSDSPEDIAADRENFDEKNQRHQEKLGKLTKKRDKEDRALEEQRREVRKKYRPLIRDADRAETESTASGLARVQVTLWAKILLDLLKVGGAVVCVLSGLTIAFDPAQSPGAKAYAAVMGGIAFFSTVVGGLLSLFS